MKNLTLIIFLLSSLLITPVHSEEVSVVANLWPPYVDQSLPEKGLAMKIVQAAFERSGYKANIQIERWEKALTGSKMGVYEVAGAIWKTDSRQQKLLFSDAYLTNNIVFVAHVKNDIQFDSLNDLHGLLVGILKDYAYDKQFMKDAKILKFQANRLTQNLILVQQGKLDLAVADKRLALYELKHFMGNNRGEFQFLPKNLSRRELYIAAPVANPKSKTIIEKFNQGLAAIKKDGTYQKILDSYNI